MCEVQETEYYGYFPSVYLVSELIFEYNDENK
jgi:hypothetical protein